jgi:hypothetical protein
LQELQSKGEEKEGAGPKKTLIWTLYYKLQLKPKHTDRDTDTDTEGPRKALHILYLSVCTDIFYDKVGSVCVWIMGMACLGKTIIIMCFYQVVVGLTVLVINLDFWTLQL